MTKNMTDTSLQTILAERVDDLIIELTALRAKISEMKEEQQFMVKRHVIVIQLRNSPFFWNHY